ncbi:hypothetical protein Q8A73_020917 [Channa argus]|nr:hypothetical protein Q8A73_020917 [Channa argus]
MIRCGRRVLPKEEGTMIRGFDVSAAGCSSDHQSRSVAALRWPAWFSQERGREEEEEEEADRSGRQSGSGHLQLPAVQITACSSETCEVAPATRQREAAHCQLQDDEVFANLECSGEFPSYCLRCGLKVFQAGRPA